jgi:hypothetical protein
MTAVNHRLALLLVLTTIAAAASAQSLSEADVLATVRTSEPVLADGRPLAPGTYQVRLTDERPTPRPGQSAAAQQWVELVADGSVMAREVAEVIRDDDRPEIGASAERAAEGVRVQILKGGDFLRISVKRQGVRYLIHLPVIGQDAAVPAVGSRKEP